MVLTYRPLILNEFGQSREIATPELTFLRALIDVQSRKELGVMFFNTIADAVAADIPAEVPRVEILRHNTASPVSPATYARSVTAPGHLLRFSNGGWWENCEKEIWVEQGGAVGNGVAGGTDDWAAIVNCLATTRPVCLRGRTYNISQEIPIEYVGYSIRGESANDSVLRGTGLEGHVIRVNQRQGYFGKFTVTASDARNNQPYSTDRRGIEFGGPSSDTLTGTRVEAVIVMRQPGDGVKITHVGTSSDFSGLWCNYNRGSGCLFDDGSSEGEVGSRIGILNFEEFRAVGNGGYGFGVASTSGTTSYRIDNPNAEIYDNGWNYVALGLRNAQVHIRGQNVNMSLSAVGDLGFDKTLNENRGDLGMAGPLDSRLAKAAKSEGFYVGTNSHSIELKNNRYIGVDTGVRTGTDVIGLNIDDMLFEDVTRLAVDIDPSCVDVTVRLSSLDNITTIRNSDANNVKFIIGGKEFLAIGGNSANFAVNQQVAGTISLGELNVRGSTVLLTGEGNVTDELTTLQFASLVSLPTGTLFVLTNRQAYSIKVKHAFGNIYTKSKKDVVLENEMSMLVLCVAPGVYHEVGTAAGFIQIDKFTASGTWTKPAGTKRVRFGLIAGGSGGASGALRAAGVASTGGGGGSGGGLVEMEVDASSLGSTETVTVGAPGVGGAAVTVADANGNPGTLGGASGFGNYRSRGPGVAPLGGTAATVAGGISFGAYAFPSHPDSAGGSGQAGVAGNGSAGYGRSASAGGGGGGVNAANVFAGGGSGGAASLVNVTSTGNAAGATAEGGGGTVGSITTQYATILTGSGGGGGGSGGNTVNGGPGGNGALPGGGGGGGGGSRNGLSSGKGGDGGRGEVWVISIG